jgi:hypothetical protein
LDPSVENPSLSAVGILFSSFSTKSIFR